MAFSLVLPTSSAHLSPASWRDFSVPPFPSSPAASEPSWSSPQSHGYSRNYADMAGWTRRLSSCGARLLDPTVNARQEKMLPLERTRSAMTLESVVVYVRPRRYIVECLLLDTG